jgi:3-oxoacyl-(acyl-carrier-protein) synthase
MSKVYVTGMGIVSALGMGVEQNHEALQDGKSGIKSAQHLDSQYATQKPFAEVKLSNQNLKEILEIAANKNVSRTDLLAQLAFEEAIENAGLLPHQISSTQSAFITASTAGGMCHTNELYHDATTVDGSATAYLGQYSTQSHSKYIAQKFGIKGIVSVFNTACSSSANAIMFGARLIKSGRAIRVIVGGVDSLGKFTVNGFNSLGILSSQPCKPFDKNRDGLTLGEGAAYLVLENEEAAKSKFKLAEVSGYGNANDAFHASAISENATGPTEAMKIALNTANLKPEDISFINAHGTGTENNDRSELKAIQNVFGGFPPFNSTKGYTGHTLGAAGAIEAVYSVLSLLENEIYASLNAEIPIEEFNILPNQHLEKDVDLKHVMSNSFGFAGNCSSLIFSKV